jgi:DeoR/GlpR family transcriptional regulator of sugar metabolism
MVKLLKEERQRRILEVLQEQKWVTVPELSSRFGISEVTIRRDLHELAVSGKLYRAHRGAIETVPAPPEPPVVQRMILEQENKERIAQAAAQLIQNGDSVFIGSGSTTTLVARWLLSRSHLTVVTNSLNIAVELSAGEDVTVVMTGGVLRRSELSVLGHIAEQSLQELRVDKVVMGVQALSIEGGWTTDHMPEVTTTRRILEMASQLIIVTDHTKLERIAAAYIAPIKRITTLVTDRKADAGFLSRVEALGVQIIQA